MASSKYIKLFEPFHIGKVQLKNRIVKTAAQTYFFDSGAHRVSSIALAYYEALAKGGAASIIVETPAMESPLLEKGDRRHRVDNDKYIKDLAVLAKAIKKHDCRAFMQFYHRGPWGKEYNLIAPRMAASSVEFYSEYDVAEEKPPKAMTITDIEELIDRFASGAVRIQKAGFDGMEINAAADHTFHTFISRYWNRRTDKYGPQSLENRMRLIVDTVKEIKKRCGQDWPVQIMMNAFEFGVGDEGITWEEGKQIAKVYEQIGVDSLHVRTHMVGHHQGSYNQDNLFYPEPIMPMKDFPKEMDWSHKGALVNVPSAALIKSVVSLPIQSVSGFDADSAEKVLREGKADLIGMNRRLFADPAYPNKVKEGRMEDIQPCTHCGNCTKLYNLPRQCRINASFGTDQYEVKKASKKKKVVVVGGGPAGMQAARVAAMRGHDVTLYESGHFLGGSLPMAATIKGTDLEPIPDIYKWFKTQITKLGVKIKLGKEYTASTILEEKPDTVVIAAGAVPSYPDVPGLDSPNVLKTTKLYNFLRFILRFFSPAFGNWFTKVFWTPMGWKLWKPVGKRIVIIGGKIHGCQLGEFFTKRGRKVTIVHTGDDLGALMSPEKKNRLFLWFKKKGVEMLAGVKLVEITPKGLTVITKDGEKKTLEADTIIPVGFEANTELYNSLKGKVPKLFNIGDCDNPAIIPDATAAGWKVGNMI